jgi:hypothetical protein
MATVLGLIGAGLATGFGFVVAAESVRFAEKEFKEGYDVIKHEFADARKNPEVSPLQDNIDINTKVTKGERELLKSLIEKN